MKFDTETSLQGSTFYWLSTLVLSALLVATAFLGTAAANDVAQRPGAFLIAQNQAGGQDVQVQNPGDNMNVQPEDQTPLQPNNQMNQQGEMYQQDPQDLEDIPGNEDLTYFDPDSIPESVFPENADWAFNIPISVSNLAPEVERLGLICRTRYYINNADEITGNRWKGTPHHSPENDIVICGEAKKRIPLIDGAFNGNVIVGIQMKPDVSGGLHHRYWQAREYECWMYLVGDYEEGNNRWLVPSTDAVNPSWRRADPLQSFNWQTGRQAIPPAYRPEPP